MVGPEENTAMSMPLGNTNQLYHHDSGNYMSAENLPQLGHVILAIRASQLLQIDTRRPSTAETLCLGEFVLYKDSLTTGRMSRQFETSLVLARGGRQSGSTEPT